MWEGEMKNKEGQRKNAEEKRKKSYTFQNQVTRKPSYMLAAQSREMTP